MFDPLSLFSFSFFGNLHLGWFITGAILVYALVYSLILLYHWYRYSIHPATASLFMIIYFAVTVPLCITLIAATAALQS
jgi:hypothetical protein